MAHSALEGLSKKGVYGRPWKEFFGDLKNEIKEDNVSNGAAALAYYLMLAIFPAMIFLLSLLPHLPIPNLQQAIMDLLNQALPGEASQVFSGTVQEIVSQKKGGLLSFGALATLWAASSGMYAMMQQLNITYDVTEGRGLLKARGTAVLLTIGFGILVIGAFALVILGGQLQTWLGSTLKIGQPLLIAFRLARWLIIAAALTLAFALTFYFAPDVKQKFRFITPGSILGVVLLVLASVAFKLYVDNFGKYSATYGSIGAVIILMLWLNITGLVLLLGSEINALIEHYSPEGKLKGQKDENRPVGGDVRNATNPIPGSQPEGRIMQPEKLPEKFSDSVSGHPPSFGSTLKEVSLSVKNLVQSEIELIRAEIKETSRNLGRHSAQAAAFGALAALSVLPFLAFLVIGLGSLLGDRYWLSSLIVASVCATVGGIMAFRAYDKIQEQGFNLTATRRSLEREKEIVTGKIENIKDAAKRRVA